MSAKPTVAELGIDLAAQFWQRSGTGTGAIEVAFARTSASRTSAEWVLMRVSGDPEQRVLVFDRHEWESFLDGARNGEFDTAAAAPADTATPAATPAAAAAAAISDAASAPSEAASAPSEAASAPSEAASAPSEAASAPSEAASA